MSGDMTEVWPVELRAALVVELTGADGTPVMGIVVEVQLARDPAKRFSWPVYCASLRARLKAPAHLLVVSGRGRSVVRGGRATARAEGEGSAAGRGRRGGFAEGGGGEGPRVGGGGGTGAETI
jgi:uncharacterized membrane protein YgcG